MICKNPRKTLDKCGKIGYTENTNSKGAVQKCVEPLLFFFFVRKRRIAEKNESRTVPLLSLLLHHGEVHSYGSKFNS
mgnify:CR=1 FL=1